MKPRPLPEKHQDDAPHWEAARRGELRLPRCGDCGHFFWPAGPVCPTCFSERLDWALCSGRGRISSWVRFHKPYYEGDEVPYEVVQVELEEGPRLTTTFVGSDPRVGAGVQVRFRRVTDDVVLPEFAQSAEFAQEVHGR